MPPKKKTKKNGSGMTAFHAAAVAAAAPADSSAAPADGAAALPIEPYFGANGVASTRATSLPSLPGFEAFQAANSATAPPLLSTAMESTAAAAATAATAAQSTAAAAALPPGRSGPSGSVLSFFNNNITTPSIRRTTNTTTPPIRESELLTPSSMTTEEEGGGGGEAIDLCGEEGEEVCLPSISTVWECAYINYNVVNGKEGWECQWCGLSFKPRHATRAMRHVLKMKGGDIAICRAAISVNYRDRYQALYDRQVGRGDSKRKADEMISDSVTEQQEAAVKSLLDTRKHPMVSGVRKSPHSLSSSHVASASGGAARSSSSASLQGQRQLSSMQLDIRRSNDAVVEMAIADFFHCENIPDAVVESSRFKRLISVCRLVGDKFVPPNANKIGGALLDLNFKMTYERNKEELLKEARVFGIAIMGDGATIHRMPLMNVLAMSGTTSPVTVGIVDCTTHMAEGGKKDAPYISGIFEEKVMEYDPNMSLTDVFFFDGASNVQKAGQVLKAKFPRTFCFHGGEHVVSLFFTDIARIEPVKVCHILLSIFNYNHDNHVPSVSTDFDSKNVQVVQCLFIGRQPRYLCSIHGPVVYGQ